jgi:hypothetical protein
MESHEENQTIPIGSQLEAEAQRLIREGKMPSLEKLLQAIAETRAEYRHKILAAQKQRKNHCEDA